MNAKLRIWRVVPTSKTGSQAPFFFVETTEENLEKAKLSAMKIARTKTSLSRFDEWVLNVTKETLRIDKLGRYFKYHQ